MPTWLGILLLGNLLGRRRRSFGRSLLFGGLLGWLFHRNFDLEEMQADVHKAARKVRKAVRKAKRDFRDIGRTVREEVRQSAEMAAEAGENQAQEARTEPDAELEAIREKIRNVRSVREERREAVREMVENVRERKMQRRQEIADHLAAVRAEIAERKAERQKAAADPVPVKETVTETVREPVQEVHAAPVLHYNPNEDLVAELEKNARTAAMAADVPTIDFPEEEKYYASRKYSSACQ